MISEGDKLRLLLEELVTLMDECKDKDDFKKYYEHELEYEDTIRALNLLERSYHYYIEK